MNELTLLQQLTFGLLGLAILSLWLPPVRLSATVAVPPWIALFGAAVVWALLSGVLTLTGLAALAVFGALAWVTGSPQRTRTVRLAAGIGTALLGLALAVHKIPGFANPQLIAGVRFTPDAQPFTQYANFDKGAVGLLLLALVCPRAANGVQWRTLLRRSWPIAAVTISSVMVVAMLTQVVRPALKWPDYTLVFLVTNLLLTCVAEEAFFRGFLQHALAQRKPASRSWQVAALLVSATLFGLAHLGGGAAYALLATLCGIGYGAAFAVTGRTEAAILTHFAFNAVHFVGFTYPAIASS